MEEGTGTEGTAEKYHKPYQINETLASVPTLGKAAPGCFPRGIGPAPRGAPQNQAFSCQTETPGTVRFITFGAARFIYLLACV